MAPSAYEGKFAIWKTGLIGQKVCPILGATAGGALLFREKVETVQLFYLDKKCVWSSWKDPFKPPRFRKKLPESKGCR